MTTRKEALVDALIRHLSRRGIADLSLRPMAEAAGTSARLLIFHFGSKERLIAEVLTEMQARLRRSASRLKIAGDPTVPPLKAFWEWAVREENAASLGLLYQLHMLALQDPDTYGRYLKRNSEDWLGAIRAASSAGRRSAADATLIGAVFDGLFLEFLSTGDKRRTGRALDRFIELAGPEPVRRPRPTKRKP